MRKAFLVLMAVASLGIFMIGCEPEKEKDDKGKKKPTTEKPKPKDTEEKGSETK